MRKTQLKPTLKSLQSKVKFHFDSANVIAALEQDTAIIADILTALKEHDDQHSWELPEADGELALQWENNTPVLVFEANNANFMETFREEMKEQSRGHGRNKSLTDLAMHKSHGRLAMIEDTLS